jgi:hypothetical protein
MSALLVVETHLQRGIEVSLTPQARNRRAYGSVGRDPPRIQLLFHSLTKTRVGKPQLPFLEPDLIISPGLVTELGLQLIDLSFERVALPFESLMESGTHIPTHRASFPERSAPSSPPATAPHRGSEWAADERGVKETRDPATDGLDAAAQEGWAPPSVQGKGVPRPPPGGDKVGASCGPGVPQA